MFHLIKRRKLKCWIFVRDLFGVLGGVYYNKQDRLVFAFPFIFPVVGTQEQPTKAILLKQVKDTNAN